jgi:hypothetical protein
MRNYLLITALVLTGLLRQHPLAAQSSRDCAAVWNGFSQSWGYNHRLNRLGDQIQIPDLIPQNCKILSTHTAASGSGADVADFTSYATTVKSLGNRFHQYESVLEFEGKEGNLIHSEIELVLPYSECQNPDWSVNAVLNGFDLFTAEGAKADKVHGFYLGIDSVWTDLEALKVHIRIAADLLFSCSSLECERFNNEVHYQMKVQCLVVHGTDVEASHDRIGRGLSWTRDSLADSAPISTSVLGRPGYRSAALGIKSLRVMLDDEHHFSDWSMYVSPGFYDASSGLMQYKAGLYFGQWNPEQYDAFRKYYIGKPAIPPKWAVKRESGSAIMEIGLTLLQFQNADTSPDSLKGQIHWKTVPGRQIPASDSMAVSRQMLPQH